jgi:2'-5' RNA ligase
VPESRTVLRLFVALDLPAQVRDRLAAVQAEIAAEGLPLRWTRAAGVHLTLVFLGATAAQRRATVEREVAAVAAHSGPLALGAAGLGCFPDGTRPRVLWAGFGGDVEALGRLQRDLAESLRRRGFAIERRPFQPHATLARVRTPLDPGQAQRLARILDAHREGEFGAWVAREIVLMHSDLGPGGSIYTQLFAAPLGALGPSCVAAICWTRQRSGR